MKMKELDDELELELGDLDEEVEETIHLGDDDFNEEDYIFNENPIIKKENSENTLIEELLKLKGIKDSKIKILDENNEETEVSFYELTPEEQLDILNTKDSEENNINQNIGEEEESFLAYLKENNLTVAKYLELYKAAAISEVENKYDKSYDIDAYGDEELFLLDLKAKYDLTDAELEKELTKATEDQELFNKKVSKLRQEYKELEDAYNKQQEAEFTSKRQEEYNTFAQTMVKTAVDNPELYGIELDDNEKNEVLSYLLDLDENGTSNFYKELNTPERLYEAAWFLKYGKQAFETLIDAYEQEIKKIKTDAPSKPVAVIKKENKVKSIYDLN